MSKRIQTLAAIVLTFVSLAAHAGHAQTPPKSNSDEATLRQMVPATSGWLERA